MPSAGTSVGAVEVTVNGAPLSEARLRGPHRRPGRAVGPRPRPVLAAVPRPDLRHHRQRHVRHRQPGRPRLQQRGRAGGRPAGRDHRARRRAEPERPPRAGRLRPRPGPPPGPGVAVAELHHHDRLRRRPPDRGRAGPHGRRRLLDRHPRLPPAAGHRLRLPHRAGPGHRVRLVGERQHAPLQEGRQVGTGPTLHYGDDLLRFKVRASCRRGGPRGRGPGVEPRHPGGDRRHVGHGEGRKRRRPGHQRTRWPTTRSRERPPFGSTITRGTGVVGVKDATEADALARAMATSATAEYVVAKGEALGNPLLKAGTEVEVDGRRHQAVAAATCSRASSTCWASTSSSPGSCPGDATPTPSSTSSGDRAANPIWGERGVVIGIVTNNKDPEGLGRIKVRFPTLSDADESWWARVAAIGAGATRGLNVLVEVNDEVLVAFEHGDVRRPIVLGGLWSKKNKPHEGGKETDTEGVASRVWRSRTGHTVSMHDSSTPGPVLRRHRPGRQQDQAADGRGQGHHRQPHRHHHHVEPRTSPSRPPATCPSRGPTSSSRPCRRRRSRRSTSPARPPPPSTLEGAQAALKGSANVNVEGGALAAVKGAIVKLN